MNPSEFNCPNCSQPYSENNPPRLLTMCGHTYCHHCIKSLIVKKKQKGYKVKCPIDKTAMEMEKPNPSLFPKNIALITILNKSKIQPSQNQFLPCNSILKNNKQQQTNSSLNQIHSANNQHQSGLNYIEQKCLQHGKIKQVYCMQDDEIICTDCALFSYHRSHEIKSIASLFKSQEQMISHLNQLLAEKQKIKQKYVNKEIENQIFQLLDQKKSFVRKEIKNFFIDLFKRLEEKQKQIEMELQAKVFQIGQKLQTKIKEEFFTQQKYQKWQQQVQNIMKSNQKKIESRFDERLRNLVKDKFYKVRIQEGKLILKDIKRQEQMLIENLQNELENLKFPIGLQKVQKFIDSIEILTKSSNKKHLKSSKQVQLPLSQSRKIIRQKQKLQNSFMSHQSNKKVKAVRKQKQQALSSKKQKQQLIFVKKQDDKSSHKDKKQQKSFQLEQESLLDFNQTYQNFSKSLIIKANSQKNIHHFKMQPIIKKVQPQQKKPVEPIKKKTEILNKNVSSQAIQKKRSLSNTGSLSRVKSSSSLQKSTVRKLRSNSKSKVEFKFVHGNIIKQIEQDMLQTVDLTGLEIQHEEMKHIVKVISKSSKIKTVKMMRNNLDDSFINQSFKYLLGVQKLNLAQNKFTQEAVNKILEILGSTEKYRMNYLNLGQNRIVERKNRKVLQEFKKLEINIVL